MTSTDACSSSMRISASRALTSSLSIAGLRMSPASPPVQHTSTVLTPIAFGFLPMALAAALACILAFAGVSLGLEWLVFVGGAVAAYALLLPVGKRIARGHGGPASVGAERWVGRQAQVLEEIPARGT